jgi:hypothetical protein
MEARASCSTRDFKLENNFFEKTRKSFLPPFVTMGKERRLNGEIGNGCTYYKASGAAIVKIHTLLMFWRFPSTKFSGFDMSFSFTTVCTGLLPRLLFLIFGFGLLRVLLLPN